MSDTPIYDNVVNPAPTFDSIVEHAQKEKEARQDAQAQIIEIANQATKGNWTAFAKAIVAGIIGFTGAFLSALLPFVVEGHSITAAGWITAASAGIAFLGASYGIVYATPNTARK